MIRNGCDAFRDPLVEDAFGELDGEGRRTLLAHVEHCASCRTARARLREARHWLRQGAPEAGAESPAAPRVIVLTPSPARRWSRLAQLAAAAAVASLAALALGRAHIEVGSGGISIGIGGAGDSESTAMSQARDEVQAAVAAAQRASDGDRDALAASLMERIAALEGRLRDERDSQMHALLADFDLRREEDLAFLLGQIGALEQRTGQRMALSSEWVRQAVLRRSGTAIAR